MFKTVVWASDGSAAAERSLPFPKGTAQSSGGRLIVVYVNEIRVDSRAALATTMANIEDEGLAAVRRKAEEGHKTSDLTPASKPPPGATRRSYATPKLTQLTASREPNGLALGRPAGLPYRTFSQVEAVRAGLTQGH